MLNDTINWTLCEFLHADGGYVGHDKQPMVVIQLQEFYSTDVSTSKNSVVGMTRPEAKRLMLALLRELGKNGDEQAERICAVEGIATS